MPAPFKHSPERDSQDDSDDDFISKSSQKRDADAIHRLAAALVELRPSDYAKAPLDPDMREHVDQARRVTAHIALKRQILFVAKQLRKRPEALAALTIHVDQPKAERQKQTARMHRIEQWRERLIDQGDAALSVYVDEHPTADRQELRSLVRSCERARAAERNDGSYHALYKLLASYDDARSKRESDDSAEQTAQPDVQDS